MQRALHLLLLQHNEADASTLREALGDVSGELPTQLVVARSAGEAEQVLASQPIDLILLDQLALDSDPSAEGSGLNWLQTFKTSHPRRRIPVIMLTRSSDDQSVREAYQQYASAYLVRPIEPGALRQMLEALLQYWGQVARLPPAPLS